MGYSMLISFEIHRNLHECDFLRNEDEFLEFRVIFIFLKFQILGVIKGAPLLKLKSKLPIGSSSNLTHMKVV